MARSLRWKSLIPGFVAIAVVLALATTILVFGRAGSLRGGKFTLFVTTDGARGVIRGTEVWLDGKKVGLVSSIDFRPPSVRPDERLVIRMSILDRARAHIRGDSHVNIQSGVSILGDQVVSLSSGTVSKPELRDGDTLHAAVQADLEGITSDASLAARELPGIMQNVKLLTAQLRTARGTFAALGFDNGSNMQSIRQRTEHILAKLSDSTGTFGLAMRSGVISATSPIQASAQHAMAEVDSIRALLNSNQHSLGRFRRDTTLRIEIGRIRSELADAQRKLNEPIGTLGRLRADSALVRAVAADRAAMDSLFIDLKRHPIRYIPF